MQRDLAQDLVRIGLSEKEAKVYLAGLELGPATAQQLAAKAVVNRPTTYIMIESLIKRGLMSSFDKGKRRYFVSSTPDKIEMIIVRERDAAIKKVEDFKTLLPSLLAETKLVSAPRVQMYEGNDGLEAMHVELLSAAKKAGSIFNIAAIDVARESMQAADLKPLWDDLVINNTSVKTLYTQEKEGEAGIPAGRGLWEARKISKKKFPFEGEITVCGNKIFALNLRGRPYGIVIDSKEISDTLLALFNLAWLAASE